jgi:hypothetical protein
MGPNYCECLKGRFIPVTQVVYSTECIFTDSVAVRFLHLFRNGRGPITRIRVGRMESALHASDPHPELR